MFSIWCRIFSPKKILGTDISQYAKGVQGIFINMIFKKDLVIKLKILVIIGFV